LERRTRGAERRELALQGEEQLATRILATMAGAAAHDDATHRLSYGLQRDTSSETLRLNPTA
jgi:hypothetical protein